LKRKKVKERGKKTKSVGVGGRREDLPPFRKRHKGSGRQ